MAIDDFPVLTPQNLLDLDATVRVVLADLELPDDEGSWTEAQRGEYFSTCREKCYEKGLGPHFDILVISLGGEAIANEAAKLE